MSSIQDGFVKADGPITSPGAIEQIVLTNAVNEGDTLTGFLTGANGAVNAAFDPADITVKYNGTLCTLTPTVGGVAITLFNCAAAAAGDGIIALAYTGGGSNIGISYVRCGVQEVDPAGGVNTIEGGYQVSLISGQKDATDGITTASGGAGNAAHSGSNVTDQDGCQIVAFIQGDPYEDFEYTAGTGFTLQRTFNTGGGTVVPQTWASEYRVQASAGAAPGTFQEVSVHASVNAVTCMIALSPPGGGGGSGGGPGGGQYYYGN